MLRILVALLLILFVLLVLLVLLIPPVLLYYVFLSPSPDPPPLPGCTHYYVLCLLASDRLVVVLSRSVHVPTRLSLYVIRPNALWSRESGCACSC